MSTTPRLADVPLFIDGNYSQGSGEAFDNIYPATGEALCAVAGASAADCDDAIASALEGFKRWSRTPPAERSRVLRRAAEIVRTYQRELAELEVYDTGKPIREAEPDDIVTAIDCLDYMGAQAASIHGHQFDFGESFAYTRREPLGVCAGIGAWNYPIQLAAWKVAPCLAAGNAMVYKPSELTPTNAVRLAAILVEAGVPRGVFNVVHGGKDVGHYLATHSAIAKVSVTGSVPTGRRVAVSAGEHLKKVTLELGGKSPLIIFEDADFESALGAALAANFYSQGENCCNGTRVFVHASLYERFIAALAERTAKLIVGNPMDPATQIGSLISRDHRDRVMGFIEAGKQSGARLVAGGVNPIIPGFEGGSFVAPTIFADCHDDMTIVSEEIFGPVMSVLQFHSEDEVVARANATEFGLAAGVFSRDIRQAHRVIGQIEAGVCWLNTYNYAPASLPFGGYKQSGIGRENGIYAIDHYTQIKSVYVELGKPSFPFDAQSENPSPILSN
jgi:betaine-aldehyde dehydrogenase